MIKNSLYALAILLISGNLLAGNIQIIEEALELSIEQVLLPGTRTGSLSIRRCGDCASERLPLDAATGLFIGKESASLDAFRAASRSSKAIYIYYDAKTGVVTRMVLDMPHRLADGKTR